MKITQLDNILKRDNPTELYDITGVSFIYPMDLNFTIFQYIVSDFEEMRMDLVCNAIYGDTEHIDMLCSLNDIKNPLSIKEGTVILYVPSDQITNLQISDINKDYVRKVISNRRKQQKIDPKRTKYLEEQGYSLPPTITKSDYRPIKHHGGKTHIGAGIFDV